MRRVLSLARSLGPHREAPSVKNEEIISDKKKRVESRACALTRRTPSHIIGEQERANLYSRSFERNFLYTTAYVV